MRTPELYQDAFITEVPYFEKGALDKKVCWVFFKYIYANRYFSGEKKELFSAAEQVGKMHASLKKDYNQEMAVPFSQPENFDKPFLTFSEWQGFCQKIEAKADEDKGEYDWMFLENKQLLEEAIKFVENGFNLLTDNADIQNIHYDLNASNFLVDNEENAVIMDLDDIKLGNIYTDIGFAFHRLITVCLERGEKDLPELIRTFLAAYMKGNPSFTLDSRKFVIGMINRALRNIRANLVLKYTEGSKEWMSAIPTNIKRIEQVLYLAKAIEETEEKNPLTSFTSRFKEMSVVLSN